MSTKGQWHWVNVIEAHRYAVQYRQTDIEQIWAESVMLDSATDCLHLPSLA